jgi:hypothetical protein
VQGWRRLSAMGSRLSRIPPDADVPLHVTKWHANAYDREKFIEAVEKLVTGEGDMRQRLCSAYRALSISEVDDLPGDMQDEWRWVQHQMTRFGPMYVQGEVWIGPIEHTISRIRNRTGAKIAKRIYRMHGALTYRVRDTQGVNRG